MATFDVDNFPPGVVAFLRERHLATLSSLRADGSIHVVPVGFSYDGASGVARVITFASSAKVANARRGSIGALSQVDGGRWLTLEGPLRLVTDPTGIAAAVAGYAARYRPPGERPDRVALELIVERAMGRCPD